MEESQVSCLVLLHPGVEELECVAPVDVLRRAGVSVAVVSTAESTVIGRNGMALTADLVWGDLGEPLFDMVFIPGGPGTAALREDERVLDLVRKHAAEGKWLAAICAAPTVLEMAGVLNGCPVTGHFSVWDHLPNVQKESAHVVCGEILTSQGAGTATEFGLILAELLTSRAVAEEVACSICWQHEIPVFER